MVFYGRVVLDDVFPLLRRKLVLRQEYYYRGCSCVWYLGIVQMTGTTRGHLCQTGMGAVVRVVLWLRWGHGGSWLVF